MSKEKTVLAYDICSTPDGVTLDKIVQAWKEHNVIIYDSHKGSKPDVHNHVGVRPLMIDVSTTEEETLKQIQKLIEP